MKKGFIAITTVLIISVVVIALVATIFTLSFSESQSSLALEKGENAVQFSEGCVEDVLLRIRSDENYSATEITYPHGVCYVDIAKNGTTWTVKVHANISDYERSLRVVFEKTITGIVMTQWEEL
jgi:hypothetical protein